MRYLFFAALLCISRLSSANNFDTYKEHIAQDRLLLIFNKGVTVEQKEQLIHASGLVSDFTHLPSPASTICFVSDVNKASNYFGASAQVAFVSFFITDAQNHYAGVLNDFFVKLKDKNFEPMLREKLKAYNLSEPKADTYIPNLYRIWNTQSKTKNTVDWCSSFLNENWVDYAVPNYLLNPLVNTNDPYYFRQWHLSNTGSSAQGHGTAGADMHMDSAWTITTGDPNIKVAVIDAGTDTLHPDLMPNLLPGHDAIDDSFDTHGYPTPNFADDGHGTCCSGIIAAVKDNNKDVAGVAPDCKIIPVHVFYYVHVTSNAPLPYSTAAAFADAIGWAWDTAQADILSNSWGLPAALIPFLPGGTQPVDDAIQQAYLHGRNGKGVAMFFSSGNDNDSIGPIWPGNLPQTISVNATTMCDTRKSPTDCSPENWWGGDFGTGLDFSAPGVWIATTDMLGANGFSPYDYYLTFNGTSAACPNAAAIGALLLSVRPDLNAEDVRNLIARGCDKVGGYGYDSLYANGTWCRELGYGRVNAFNSLQLAFSYSGINEAAKNVEFNVFPNPTKGLMNIAYNGDDKAVQLYDITGKLLKGFVLHKGLNTEDVSELSAGLYLLSVDTGAGIVTRKVTILR
ncbi:MAG: hypothetical protein JWO06_822 [Bacteroidota bacterium]|nr:hypothetical protein [Bacteroidota bacterium]